MTDTPRTERAPLLAALPRRSFIAVAAALTVLSACAPQTAPQAPASASGLAPGETPELRVLVEKYAQIYDVPVSLFTRVIEEESGFNPNARNGQYYGLMQILPTTAGTMGYSGSPSGLLDPETNLKYGGKYLYGAWIVSQMNADQAIYWYRHGYYDEAKRLGLLKMTGLGS